jgi:hypothetical protein
MSTGIERGMLGNDVTGNATLLKKVTREHL